MHATPFVESDRLRLGRTELMVTPIALGGAFLGQTPTSWDDGLAIATVLRALELGINLIDTSPLYGDSERRIGQALRQWTAAGGRREDILLSSKTGTRERPPNYTAAHTRESIAITLDLLGTDYLDIVYIHDPYELDSVLAQGAAYDVLCEMKAAGVVRHIGLGARPHEFHQRLLAADAIDALITFSDFHLLRQTARDAVLRPARAADVGVFAASLTCYGVLSGLEPEEVIPHGHLGRRVVTPEEFDLAGEIWTWCQALEVDLLALNLQYCLREPGVSALLLGASIPEHIEADVAAIQTALPSTIWSDLARDFGIANGA